MVESLSCSCTGLISRSLTANDGLRPDTGLRGTHVTPVFWICATPVLSRLVRLAFLNMMALLMTWLFLGSRCTTVNVARAPFDFDLLTRLRILLWWIASEILPMIRPMALLGRLQLICRLAMPSSLLLVDVVVLEVRIMIGLCMTVVVAFRCPIWLLSCLSLLCTVPLSMVRVM